MPPNPVPDAAREFLRLGWVPVPIPQGAKAPVLQGWQRFRPTKAKLEDLFMPAGNIGILTGSASRGLIDVDLDCEESVKLAPAFLPATPMRSGRPSRPKSHRWYVADHVPDYTIFKDVDGDATTLLELRGDGHQTVVPPSVHPDGESYIWHGPLEPKKVHGQDLARDVHRLAAATILARHWPRKPGSRHAIANALAGALLRGGWPEEKVVHFVQSIARAVGDEEASQRARAAVATARQLRSGGHATGTPTLADLIGDPVVRKVREWLGLSTLSAFNAYTAYPDAARTSWPDPLADAAYQGLPGEFVHLVEPHTEADPAAILIQFLVAFGNCVGRGPHFLVEADQHHLNLFAAIVGQTSKGRKGTSWGQVRRLFIPRDDCWAQNCIVSGLSSGEGLIWAVRDEITRTKKGKLEVVDQGVEDKRLLVVESELASALRVLAREGNTLSATVRSAWDTGDLRTLTKNSPAKATGAHISILGHISRDELVRYLDTTEMANGFANRFVWACARRSKCLPDGGHLDELDLKPLQARLASAICHARTVERLQRDPEASALWHSVYERLSEGKPGLFGAVISRAEAQVTRLSSLYALIDRATEVRLEHLRAALAVWTYSEASAAYIFGDSLGDPVADTILKALRSNPAGRTRSEIRNLFGRNLSSARISRALATLLSNGLARFEPEETEGRPAERWFAVSGYALNAINAKSPTRQDPYGVYGVNGVERPGAESSSPEDTSGDDEVVL